MSKRWTLFPLLALVAAMAGTWLGEHAGSLAVADDAAQQPPAQVQPPKPAAPDRPVEVPRFSSRTRPNFALSNATHPGPWRTVQRSAADPGPGPLAGPTFVSVRIAIDPRGEPLAAYQVELDTAGADFLVVGIEPGDVPAYPREPYYDLNANQRNTDRLILANYSVADADDLPRDPVVVVTVNLALVGSYPADDLPPLALKLTACYGPDGKKINAQASYEMSVPVRERGD